MCMPINEQIEASLDAMDYLEDLASQVIDQGQTLIDAIAVERAHLVRLYKETRVDE